MFQNLTIVPEGSIAGPGYCDSARGSEDGGCVGSEGFNAILLKAAALLVHTRMGANAHTTLDQWLLESRCHGCAWYRVQTTWNLLHSGTTGNGEHS